MTFTPESFEGFSQKSVICKLNCILSFSETIKSTKVEKCLAWSAIVFLHKGNLAPPPR